MLQYVAKSVPASYHQADGTCPFSFGAGVIRCDTQASEFLDLLLLGLF